MATTADHQRPLGRRSRTHNTLNDFQKRAIREKHRESRSLTQTQLAAWASTTFNRPVSQSTISDCLQPRYATLDLLSVRSRLSAPSNRCPECLGHRGSTPCYRCSGLPLLRTFELPVAPRQGATRPDCGDPAHPSKAERHLEEYSLRELAVVPRQRRLWTFPQQIDASTIWFPRLIDEISTSVPAHRGTTGTQVDMMSTWFSHLTTAIGKNHILDEALRSFALYHIGLTLDDPSILRRGQIKYGRALSGLQKSIGAPEPVVTAETVMTTMILSLFELCTAADNDGWLRHTRGAAHLMNLVDPSSFSDDVGLLFVRTFSRQWVAAAFETNDTRFLSSPIFLRAMSQPVAGSGYQRCKFGQFQNPQHAFQLYARVTVAARKILQAKSRDEALQTLPEMQALRVQAEQDFMALYNLAPPLAVPSSDKGDRYRTVYRYLDQCHASCHLGFRAGIIGIAEFLKILQPDNRELDRAIEHQADEICRSVDFIIESGFLGAVSLAQTFSTLLLSDLPEQCQWIRKRLRTAWMARSGHPT